MPDGDRLKSLPLIIDYSTFTEEQPLLEKKPVKEVKVDLSPSNAPQSHNAEAPISTKTTLQILFPALLLVASSFMYSLMGCAVRFTTNNYGLSIAFIILFRSLVTMTIPGILILFFRKTIFAVPLPTKSLILLYFRGLLGAVTMFFHYSALARLPLAIAASLFCTRPIFASLFGLIILGEQLTITDQVALILSIIGTLLVGMSEPSTAMTGAPSQYIHGVILALSAACGAGLVYVCMRKMGTKVNFLLSAFSMSSNAVAISLFLHLSHAGGAMTWLAFSPTEVRELPRGALVALMGIGLFACGGCLSLNRGAQLVPAGRAGVLRTADIPVNVLVGLVFLGEMPHSVLQLLGCAMIALSAYLVAC